MTDSGFLTRQTGSPGKFGLVVLLHAGLILAVMMTKMTVFIDRDTRTSTFNVPHVDPPQPDPQPQRREQRTEPRPTPVDLTTPVVHAPDPQVPFQPPQTGPVTGTAGAGDATTNGTVAAPPSDPPRAPPVRADAQFDPRYSGDLQPPYPPSEQRAEHEGAVRVRVSIDPGGRVTAVERLSATSDAFFETTRRQALARWRFRPATEDGRPIASSKALTVTFRLNN